MIKKKTMTFSFCICNLEYNTERHILLITLINKGKKIATSVIGDIRETFAKKFILKFTEQDAKEIFNNNINIL